MLNGTEGIAGSVPLGADIINCLETGYDSSVVRIEETSRVIRSLFCLSHNFVGVRYLNLWNTPIHGVGLQLWLAKLKATLNIFPMQRSHNSLNVPLVL